LTALDHAAIVSGALLMAKDGSTCLAVVTIDRVTPQNG
jgi:hypothetical protein